jgi:hypothetical protein
VPHHHHRTGSPPRLFATLGADFRTVARDVRQRGIGRSVGRTFTALENFYLTEEDRRRLAAMDRISRSLHRVWWFVVSLLMNLTPARRVLLAAALVFLLIRTIRIQSSRVHFDVSIVLPGAAIVLIVLMLELKDKLLARDELEAGRAVQLALMPGRRPAIPGWEAWLYTQPANDVGGDLVDHLALDPSRHAVSLGDVSGKALPAALLSVKLQATLRALAPRFERLADLGAAVNEILFRDGLPSRFASLAYLELSSDTGRVRVLNAGHMPPLLVRGDAIVTLDRGSMVLGLMPEATFEEQAVDLDPGDTLVIYSDGVTEAMDEAEEFFGDERLAAALEGACHVSVETVGARVLEALAGFVGEAVASDDVSLIVVRRVKSGG